MGSSGVFRPEQLEVDDCPVFTKAHKSSLARHLTPGNPPVDGVLYIIPPLLSLYIVPNTETTHRIPLVL